MGQRPTLLAKAIVFLKAALLELSPNNIFTEVLNFFYDRGNAVAAVFPFYIKIKLSNINVYV